MKLINVEIDANRIDENLIKLSDVVRLELFKNDEESFEKLDYDNDNIFLDPSLLYFIFEKANNTVSIELKQLLWGYMDNDIKPAVIDVTTDADGKIYLPNYGYFIFFPNTKFQLRYDQNNQNAFFVFNGEKQPLALIKNIFLANSGIRICQHKNRIIDKQYSELVEETLSKYKPVIDESWLKLQKLAPDFCSLIQKTTKEIFLFDCENQNSFAAMSNFGSVFINVNNIEANEIFFIDDLAHQCGHIILYALELNFHELFLLPPNTPFSNFLPINDPRTIYDIFHGLFTYTTVLFALEKCYDSNDFSDTQRHEIIGRIGFYLQKFAIDLEFMDNPAILSERGIRFYNMFREGFNYLSVKFYRLIADFSYLNQNYFFSYKLFSALNINLKTAT